MGSRAQALGWATSSTRWPSQRPPAPRKVAMPLSAEMPAPVRTAIEPALGAMPHLVDRRLGDGSLSQDSRFGSGGVHHGRGHAARRRAAVQDEEILLMGEGLRHGSRVEALRLPRWVGARHREGFAEGLEEFRHDGVIGYAKGDEAGVGSEPRGAALGPVEEQREGAGPEPFREPAGGGG